MVKNSEYFEHALKAFQKVNYTDMDLDKLAAENMSNEPNFAYKGKMINSLFAKTGKRIHPKIDFLYTGGPDDAQIATVKIVNSKEDEAEIKMLKFISTEEDLAFRTLFIRSVYVNNRIYMDYFTHNCLDLLESSKTIDPSGSANILDMTLSVLARLKHHGYCFTDIKVEQILVRPYNKNRGGFYKSIRYNNDRYEFAMGDLDIDKCRGEFGVIIYTFALPEFIRKQTKSSEEYSERQLLWSLGVTILDLYKVKYGDLSQKSSVDLALANLKKHKARSNHIEYARDCLKHGRITWKESSLSTISGVERPVSRRN